MAEEQFARKFVTKNESVILKAIGDAKQVNVAAGMGKNYASYVSTFLSGSQNISFTEMLGLLDAAGLSVHRCTEDAVIVPAEEWKQTLCYAKRYWNGRDD